MKKEVSEKNPNEETSAGIVHHKDAEQKLEDVEARVKSKVKAARNDLAKNAGWMGENGPRTEQNR